MVENELAFCKERYEVKLKHKDEEITDLIRQNESSLKIRTEIKKDLINKTHECEKYIEQTKEAEQSLKEAENKSENLKLMLVN